MKKTLVVALVACLFVTVASADVMYRETFARLGGPTSAGVWDTAIGRNGLASSEGWFGFSSKAKSVSKSSVVKPFNFPWGLNSQAATWTTGPLRSPAITNSPGEADGTQINSAVNTPGGIAIGAAVPAAPYVVGQIYGDLQSSAPYPSVLGWSPQAVYDAVCFTQEYPFNLADVNQMQFEASTTSSSGMNYRFLIHFGNDFDAQFPGDTTVANTLGTGWYASDAFNVAYSADGSNVWSTLTLNVGPTTNWYAATLNNWSAGGGFSVASTTSAVSGTVTAFGIYLVSPSGVSRFDNFTVVGVPEPATMSLLAMGVVGLLRRKA